ncbi:hypothetical protein [Clostridium rectalis]|uniref:hypothetical protein n=1 Tax=Clostridium rectalis TaxID=2040295 RepID=UPI000F635431|nr:hypothetical protein [Clostridium rectalis]
MKLNSKKFNFNFFLGGVKKVQSLESGALENGGATKFESGIYSNIEKDEYININKENNKISLFVPDTINVNNKTDNSKYIEFCINQLQNLYNDVNLKYYNTQGSWYSEDLKKVVYDNITILTLQLNTLTEKDIENFIDLANWIKTEMHQEGVSININDALAIV